MSRRFRWREFPGADRDATRAGDAVGSLTVTLLRAPGNGRRLIRSCVAYQHAQAAAEPWVVEVTRGRCSDRVRPGRYEGGAAARAAGVTHAWGLLRCRSRRERGLGHPEKAVEIIDATDSTTLDLAEQVELRSPSGARADSGQSDVGP